MQIRVPTDDDMLKLGEALGKCLCPGDIIGLVGELGVGKTTLVKGIAKGLKVEDFVTSPTFVIVKEYEGRIPLYHIDVYRIGDLDEIRYLAIEEYLYGEGAAVIEWADRAADLISDPYLEIEIEKAEDDINVRVIKFFPRGERYQKLTEEMKLKC